MDRLVDVVVRSMEGVWAVLVEAAPWLLVGLFAAGLAKWALPERRLVRIMGRRRWVQVVRATVVGAPLPLCSCGVLPAALGLRREGLSRPGTASFLVATPQNGADSVALSYALLGPVFTVVRVVASLLSALTAGFVTMLVAPEDADGEAKVKGDASSSGGSCCSKREAACCSSGVGVTVGESDDAEEVGACCSSTAGGNGAGRETFVSGQRYAFGRFLMDIGGWLAVGLAIAGLMQAWVEPGAAAGWASGLLAMLVILVVSVPMYICAQASTPVAAGMLAAGVSPGTVLVFLLAGPATNFAGVALVKRELGTRATAGYLGGLIVSSLGLGLAVDWLLLDAVAWTPVEAMEHGEHLVPMWLGVASAVLLLAIYGALNVRHLVAHLRTGDGETCAVCGERVGEEAMA